MLFFVIGLLHPGAIQIPWPWQKSFQNNIPLPLALSHSFHPGLHYHFLEIIKMVSLFPALLKECRWTIVFIHLFLLTGI
jgi:hypothetical protein